MFGWVAVSVFAGVTSYFSCAGATVLAKRSGMIALPGERQSHQHATPTGGGLGLVFSIVVTTLCLELMLFLPDFWWQKVLPGVLLLTIVGWRDDRHSVSSWLRLLIQLAVSVWLIGFGWWALPLKEMVFWAGVITSWMEVMEWQVSRVCLQVWQWRFFSRLAGSIQWR
jgi:UDP-N-acetylmuramyl pentapeptide phosphotransferase/UDP-N-acetylglucosamine-1-phosphate transferase